MKLSKNKLPSQTLYGISIEHSLIEDNRYHLINKMIEKLVSGDHEEVFVVQRYPEQFEQSSRFISFVGTKSENELLNEQQQLVFPATESLSITFNHKESKVDDAYQTLYDYMNLEKIELLSNFDVEMVNHNNNMTTISVPLEALHLKIQPFYSLESFLELKW